MSSILFINIILTEDGIKIFFSGPMSCVFQKTSLIKLSPRYFEMDIVVDKKLVCPILSIAVCFDSLLDVNSVL